MYLTIQKNVGVILRKIHAHTNFLPGIQQCMIQPD